jgi:hypothetical protein
MTNKNEENETEVQKIVPADKAHSTDTSALTFQWLAKLWGRSWNQHAQIWSSQNHIFTTVECIWRLVLLLREGRKRESRKVMMYSQKGHDVLAERSFTQISKVRDCPPCCVCQEPTTFLKNKTWWKKRRRWWCEKRATKHIVSGRDNMSRDKDSEYLIASLTYETPPGTQITEFRHRMQIKTQAHRQPILRVMCVDARPYSRGNCRKWPSFVGQSAHGLQETLLATWSHRKRQAQFEQEAYPA